MQFLRVLWHACIYIDHCKVTVCLCVHLLVVKLVCFSLLIVFSHPLTVAQIAVCGSVQHDGWWSYIYWLRGRCLLWKLCPVSPGDGHSHWSTLCHPQLVNIRTCTHLWGWRETACQQKGLGVKKWTSCVAGAVTPKPQRKQWGGRWFNLPLLKDDNQSSWMKRFCQNY